MRKTEQAEQWQFVRGFSSLGRLQNRKILQYTCVGQSAEDYKFSIIQQEEEKTVQEEQVIGGLTGIQAQQLVQYLFENAVPIDNWQDVLQELRQRL